MHTLPYLAFQDRYNYSLVLPSRQGNEADLVLMGTLQAKLRSNLLSNESREVLQKELANLQSEIIGGIGIDRLTKEVRY